MSVSTARRMASTIGLITAGIGGVLVVSPTTFGPLMSLADPRGARLIGAVDLALVPGLLAGRPRWPWMAARAIGNVLTAAYCLGRAHDAEAVARARVVALVLAMATVADTVAALALRSDVRCAESN
ncbi:MAG: hypothetical protein H7Y15_02960 [Pseudonocardia sp.]|nr:hypothetical protein [Pseudonocardia sp.]